MKHNNLKVILTFATGAAILASMQSAAFADNSNYSTTTGRVTADVLNIRLNPNTSSSVIGTLTYNTQITIVEISNGWYKINSNGYNGWVYGDYVALDTPTGSNSSSSSVSSGTVNADVLNVRSGNSTSYGVIGTLNYGQAVEITASYGNWYKINFNGSTGYVSSEYITAGTSSGSSSSNNSSSSSNSGSVSSYGTVTADVLNVRSGSSTSYSVIGELSSGDQVGIISIEGSWYKINYNGSIGYVSGDYISTGSSSGNSSNNSSDAPTYNGVTGKVAIVTADALNVRSGAGTGYSIIDTVRYGYKLPIISYYNGWYKVQCGSSEGYVSGDYVTVTNESDGSTANPLVKETPLIDCSYSGEDIANKAKEYLGVPYLWGGFTPMGFDCSGLVQYVYKQFGINIERTTYYQVHQGQIVDRNNLRAGDLIFFTTNDDDPNDISHVGMYVGNDLFIQAPQPGDVVRISNLNSAYYSNRYYVAKRIIK